MVDGYEQDYKAMGEFLCSKEMQEAMRVRGEIVKTTAEATAPDYPPIGVGYKESFELEVGIRNGKHPRACATVRNTSDHSMFVEFGGKATPRHRTLGKALGTGLA